MPIFTGVLSRLAALPTRRMSDSKTPWWSPGARAVPEMNLPVILTAEADFDNASDWYEHHARPGTRFTLGVRQALARIGQMSELHAVLLRDIRRAKIQSISYSLYYRVRSDQVEVITVPHGRRDPSVWRNRA
jgi:plasmid stabilization system protein ParE